MEPGEFGYLAWMHARETHSATPWREVTVGPGDDCAVVRMGDRDMLVTADALLDGSHFRLGDPGVTADRIGWKLLAVSLSDIAAMGGIPRYAVATVGLPAGWDTASKQALVAGLHRCAAQYDVAVIGGDVTSWPDTAGALTLSLTLFGEMPSNTKPVLRSGASIGDAIYVSGALGGSLRGRHLDVTPRVALGRWLAETQAATAMLDLSDGLSRDIGHILNAAQSGPLGVAIDIASVPIHPDVAQLDPAGETPPWQHALHDGEDFELCFTVSADRAAAWGASHEFEGVPLSWIGTIHPSAAGRVLLLPDGSSEPLVAGGWEHR